MTEAEAKQVKKELEALCKKHGLWFEVNEKHKPKLKDVVVTVSLKVTG